MTRNRQIPSDPTIERATIGACCIDPTAMRHAVDTLDHGDLYDPTHAAVFAAMVDLARNGTDPDPVLLASRSGIPLASIIAWTADVGSSLSVPAYCQRLAVFGTLRRAIVEAEAAVQEAMTAGTPEEGIAALTKAGASLQALDVERREMWSALEVGNELAAKLAAPREHRVVPTGIAGLDAILAGGFRPGNLVIIGARPACGKSALACNTIALHVAHTGCRVLVFSLEMDRTDLLERMVSAQSQTDLTAIRTRNLGGDDRIAIRDTISSITERDLYFDDRPTLTVRQIGSTARRMARARKVGLVVVDYLQLVKSLGNTASREQEVASISRDLKGLARELGCPVIALSQLNRGATDRGEYAEPRDSDLRESGAIEQDADVIIMLWPLGPTDDGARVVDIGCKVAKQRGGRRGRLRLLFDAPRTDFRDGGELAIQAQIAATKPQRGG